MVTPNQLTAFRIVLALLIPVLILERSLVSELAAFLAFITACVTDWWDGHIARRDSMITPLGQVIDPIADKLLILGSMFFFAWIGLYAYGWIFLIVIRELGVTITRMVLLQKGKVIPAERTGKVKFGFQVGSISATFLYLFFLDHAEGPWLPWFGALHYLGIILANVITVYSGFTFFYQLARK